MEHPATGNILIVDDNTSNIQLLGTILKTENYAISVSLNGADAIQFLKTSPIDCILLDIMMPVMDGYEVCETIKKDIFLKSIPVIFITAKCEHDSIIRGFKSGGVDYITKPFNSEELLARVSAHVELFRSRNELKKLRSMVLGQRH